MKVEGQDKSPQAFSLRKGKCQDLGWSENCSEAKYPSLSGSNSSFHCLFHLFIKGLLWEHSQRGKPRLGAGETVLIGG